MDGAFSFSVSSLSKLADIVMSNRVVEVVETILTNSDRDSRSLPLLLHNILLPALKAVLTKYQRGYPNKEENTYKLFPYRNLISSELALPLPVPRQRILCNLKLDVSFLDLILEILSFGWIDLEIL